MQKLGNPTPYWLDARGALIDGGQIYVGVADGDPETDPVQLYWDSALTIFAEQPLKTIGGLIVNGVVPASVFLAEADYSMRVRDENDVQVFYSPSIFVNTDAFQPASATLDLLSALTTTAFGRNLLTLANSAALATQTGIPNPLPLAGGSVTGNILRSGGGVHPYWANSAMTGGRIYITPEGDPDPTSQPGDIWFTY